MNTAQRVVKNFLSLATAQIISQLLGFVAVVYLARVLSAEGFGKLGFTTAILAYFMLFTNLGLNTFGTREVARNKGRINRYVNNILTMKLVASIIAFTLLAIFVYFIPQPLEIKKLILFLGLTLFTSAFVMDWLFQGIERMEFIAISRMLWQLCYVALVFWIVKSPEQLLKIPFIQVGTGIIPIAILFSVYRRTFSSIKLDFDFGFWKKMLRQSLPMGFSFIMITIYYNFDQVMLGFMKGEEVVGWYSAAYKPVLMIGGVFNLYMPTIFPLVSKYFKDSSEKLRQLLSCVSKIIIMIAIPIGFGGVILAEGIINQIYGPTYSNAALSFKILILTQAVIWLASPFAYPLIACNRQNKFMAIVSMGAITNIIFNFILIPKFSLYGAAAATLIAEIVVGVADYFVFRKEVIVFTYWSYFYKPFLASLVMAVMILVTNFDVIMSFLVGVVTYSLSILLIKGIMKSEIRQLMAWGDK